MVTAKAFVEQVWIPLLEAWGYIYGTAGRMWTKELQKAWSQPGHKNYEQTKAYGAQWIGRMVTDCSGLLCRAFRQLGVKDFVHQARYQYTDASGPKGILVNGCREDGKPVLPGTAVFLQGSQEHIHHVGVYVGHGICIEAKGTRWGVVTSKPDHWDHWGELKMVDYTNAAEIENEPVPETPDREEQDGVLFRVMVDNPGAWLNVRSGPGTGYPALFRVEKGDVAEVLAVSEDRKWDQIRYGGRVGWASAEYLTVLDDEGLPDEPDEGTDIEARDLIEGLKDVVAVMRTELESMEKALKALEGMV